MLEAFPFSFRLPSFLSQHAVPPWDFHRENLCVLLHSLNRKACIGGVWFITAW